MRAELETIDVAAVPGLAELAERVKRTGEPLRLVRGDEELAVLQPAKKRRRKSLKGRPTSMDDPIWNIVGMGRSDGPGDVSTNKHKYLAEAYLPKRQ
jgi:hypothetical protein